MLNSRYHLFKQFKEGKKSDWKIDEEICKFEEAEKEYFQLDEYVLVGSDSTHDVLHEIELDKITLAEAILAT